MTLVETNVLLDVVTRDSTWLEWSRHHLRLAASEGALVINGVIYAELSIRFDDVEPLDFFLAVSSIAMRDFSHAALFCAGRAFRNYRRNAGTRPGLLPDFFIGAGRSRISLVADP